MSFFKSWCWQKREVRCQTSTPSFCRAFPETYIAGWTYPEYYMATGVSVMVHWNSCKKKLLLLLLRLLVLIR